MLFAPEFRDTHLGPWQASAPFAEQVWQLGDVAGNAPCLIETNEGG
jgi:hypothetical protein